MTDEAIAEVYSIAREAFAGGQRNFQFQSYPFRMTPKNLAQHRYDPNMPFWKNLKEGSDYFEALRDEPKVAVCGRRYVFGGADVAQGDCAPAVDPAVAQKQPQDEQEVADARRARACSRSGSSTTTAASTILPHRPRRAASGQRFPGARRRARRAASAT